MAEEIDLIMDEPSDESGVVKALRSQIRDLERELKTRPARDDLESQIRTQLKREADAAAQLIEQGHPAGLARFMLSEIGETEITAESVAGYLKGLGYDTKPASSEGQEPASPNQQLAEVASLASRVSSAANNAPADNVMERIQRAAGRDEVRAIMEEIGAAQS